MPTKLPATWTMVKVNKKQAERMVPLRLLSKLNLKLPVRNTVLSSILTMLMPKKTRAPIGPEMPPLPEGAGSSSSAGGAPAAGGGVAGRGGIASAAAGLQGAVHDDEERQLLPGERGVDPRSDLGLVEAPVRDDEHHLAEGPRRARAAPLVEH
mmetsp:Transcript_46095/g.132025  ORF Transcript_46095/g.132025 Transcript_46095/m.132025 type:complete len:153 (-) Transcript_46095:938-1396(-)